MATKPVSDKLNIANEMLQFDKKNRDFYDDLSEEEKKKFAPFLMLRWGADVQGSAELQAYYLMSVNERLNKHFFDISGKDHKKFQWLLCTTVSPGMGKQYHKWLAAKKKTSDNKATKFFAEMYPHLRDDEIQLLAELNDKNDIKQLAKDHGWDDKRIKSDI
jgi:regulator of sigma D